MRTAHIERNTSETRIQLRLDLDQNFDPALDPTLDAELPQQEIRTGFGMLDHMLTLTAFWAGFSLYIHCEGDLHVDAHHTAEDIGLCLGQALLKALDSRSGIARVGHARVPMDEALADVTLDFSGRPWLVWRGDDLLPPIIAGQEKDLWREFYKSVCTGGRFNLHVDFQYGLNGHHLLESAAKSFGLALAQGVARTGNSVRSTKGSLD